MKPLPKSLIHSSATRWYRGADVTLRIIRQFVREVVEQFSPDQVILFGSYAKGTQHADSDVDILLVMPARNELDQAMRIREKVEASFPLDLLVRKPKNLAWRLKEREGFSTEIMERGIVLYDKKDKGMGQEGRIRLPRRRATRARSTTSP